MTLAPVLYMQAEIANLYRKEEQLTVQEFLSLDAEYGVLDFIAAGYEPFHLMGEQGILNEVREFTKHKNTSWTHGRIKFFRKHIVFSLPTAVFFGTCFTVSMSAD